MTYGLFYGNGNPYILTKIKMKSGSASCAKQSCHVPRNCEDMLRVDANRVSSRSVAASIIGEVDAASLLSLRHVLLVHIFFVCLRHLNTVYIVS